MGGLYHAVYRDSCYNKHRASPLLDTKVRMMTSASKRIVTYHVSRLQDKNPQVRLKAINELMLLADPDALDALRAVFETDADMEVRKAAQEAGRVIFLKKIQQEEEADNKGS